MRGLHRQRRHAPVEGHLAERGGVVREADSRHGAAALRAGDRRQPGAARHHEELGVEFPGDPAGPIDHGLRDRVQALDEKLRRREELLHGHAGGALLGHEPAFHVVPAVGQILLLGLTGNPPHHLHHEPRVLADRRLAGEHAGIGAVEDRVGHVGRLGPGGPAGMLHAVEHLRGHDHRLLIPLAGADDPLLHHRHAGDVGLHAKVAAGDHHGVGRFDDRLEVVDRLPLFDLGDDAGDRAASAEQFLEQLHLHGRPHERQAHELDAHRRGPLGVPPVGSAYRGHGELHAGQIHSLAAANDASLHDAADGMARVSLLDDEADRAVGDHHRVAHGQLVDQGLVGGGELAGPGGRRAADEADVVPLRDVHHAAGQFAEPDLRPREIGQHADGAGERLGNAANAVERFLVLGDRSVSHVEPKHIDTGLHEAANRLFGPRRGTERGDNLGANNLWGRGGDGHETSWRGWE